MSFRIAICAVAAACAGLAPAALADQPADVMSAAEARAEAVLGQAKDALAEPAVTPSRDLTLVLVKLSQAIPDLDGSERRAANEILARPDDGPADRYDDGFTVPEAAESPACEFQFCVHWVDTAKDAPELADDNGTDDMDGIPDYVEEVLASAGTSFAIQNAGLDWIPPLGDGGRGAGPADTTDIYLLDIDKHYYGYASPDEGQGAATAKQAYLVLDDDYKRLDSPPDFTATEAMQVTMAHEYNHVLQFAYDSQVNLQEDLWMFESTATWMENQVYPDIDDYLNYLPFYAANSKIPLTASSRDGLKVYGAAVWNHYLAETEDPAVVRDAWSASDSVAPPHLAVAAYDDALGGTGNPFGVLSKTFIDFAGSTAEWRGSNSYPDAAKHPDMKRVGKRLKLNKPRKIKLDHLAYALVDVAPDLAENDLKLKLKAPDGTYSGIELLGRRGNALSGDIESGGGILPGGGDGEAVLAGDTYGRVTAMAINADARVNGSGKYKRNNQRYKLKLVRAP